MKEFKYKSSFSSEIKCLISEEKDKYLSKASLENLAGLIPPELIAHASIDLLPFAANGALINFANRNGDALNTSDALKLYKSFIHRPINLDHKRPQVVGHVINAGFASLNDSLLNEDLISALNEPFNLSIAGYLYRLVNADITNKVEDASDPTSLAYHDYSLSWEILFNDFQILKGSKNLAQATLVSDPHEIAILTPFLQANGGDGRDKDGNYITRLITGESYGGGFAITENPAGNVKGIHVPNIISKAENEKNIEKDKEIISHIDKGGVNKRDMKNLTSVAEIQDLNSETLKEVSVSSLVTVVNEALRKGDEARKAAEDAKASEKLQAEKDAKEAKAKIEALEKDIEKIKSEKLASEAQSSFDGRMATLDEGYELGDSERKVIAKNIKSLSDEAFAEWLTDFEILAAGKKKMSKEEAAKEAQKQADDQAAKDKAAKDGKDKDDKGAKSKAELEAEAALAKVKADGHGAVMLTSQASTESLVEKYKDAFKIENLTKKNK